MAKKKKIRPPIKTHGGKYYLVDFILENFPVGYESMTYVEPYCGGGSIFLNKDRSAEECINDLDNGAICIWTALRDEPGEFIARIKRLKYTEMTFKRALNRSAKPFDDYIDHAVNEFVLRRMSRGGLKKHFAWSERSRGGQPGDVNAWETSIEQLPQIAARVANTYILNKPAIEVIKAFNNPHTLVYADPPYLPDTRVSPGNYEHDMTTDDHIELSKALTTFEGKVILSGYPSPLYNRLYQGWRCVKKKIVNHSSQQKSKKYKTEVLWLNY